MNKNYCVCCGADIPEGGQVCKQCEKKYEIEWGDSIINAVYRKGFKDGQADIMEDKTSLCTTVRFSSSQMEKIAHEAIDNVTINGVSLKQLVSERSEGHWTVGSASLVCSVCGTAHFIASDHGCMNADKYHYCPSCGARMTEGTEQ